MKRPLSLHHLSALDVGAADLVDIAAGLRCEAVCVFTYLSASHAGRFPSIETDREVAEVRSRLRQNGISVCNAELFSISPQARLSDMRPGLERAAQLGARRATAHIREPDEQVAIERFAQFCTMAREFDITVGLEFTGFFVTRTIEAAARIVVGSAARNAGIVADVLHVFRNGMSVADVARHSSLITYAQLCDGKLDVVTSHYYEEAVGNREIPGHGEFPLVDFLALLPPEVPVSMEVPLHRLRDAGLPAAERARLAVEAVRMLLGRTDQA